VVSGPTAVGKGTVVKQLSQEELHARAGVDGDCLDGESRAGSDSPDCAPGDTHRGGVRKPLRKGREEGEEDPGNQASDLYQDELDEGLADDLREELAGVARAEARLATGTYGLSVESGKPIPDERLEARPTAERTAEEEAAR